MSRASVRLGAIHAVNKAKELGGYSVSVAVMFVAGENAGAGTLALPAALIGTGWLGIALFLWVWASAGYAGLVLSRCWTLIELKWPMDAADIDSESELDDNGHIRCRDPYGLIARRAYGKIVG